MSQAVLEINDYAISLYNGDGLLASSPGFVLANGKELHFGQQAVEQSRLHPVSTNNEFWYRLGMAPLPRPLAHFRHYADIAHGHLLHLAEQSGFEGNVVIAVPASFNREQLAVLSGVVRHSRFNTLAIMDAALITANHLPENASLVYVDMQLHQLSFTRLTSEAGQVRRDAFAVVPGAGSVAISNTLVQVVNDAFIAQSRFNPQHSAQWEQQLYNELPDWLQQFDKGSQEILVQIDTNSSTVQARVGVSDVLEALQPTLQKISQHFAQFAGHAPLPVILSERASLIPGMAFCLKALPQTIDSRQVAEIGLRAIPENGAAGGVSYLSAIAREHAINKPSGVAVNSAGRADSRVTPTHIMHNSQAWPLPVSAGVDADGQLQLSRAPGSHNSELFSIKTRGSAVIFCAGSHEVSMRGRVLADSTELAAGDVLSVSRHDADLQLIRVHP